MLFPKEFQTNELLYGCWVEVRLDKTLVRHSDVAFLSHVNRLVKSCILSLTLRGDWAFLLIFPVQPCSLLICVCDPLHDSMLNWWKKDEKSNKLIIPLWKRSTLLLTFKKSTFIIYIYNDIYGGSHGLIMVAASILSTGWKWLKPPIALQAPH